MFTGIIQSLGIVERLDRQRDLLRLGISASFAGEVKIGDSISVDGVCLTVVNIEKNILYFDAIEGTLKSTNIGSLKQKDKVNLEQALKAQDKLGGHFVTGHIDTVGAVKRKIREIRQVVFEIGIDRKLMGNLVIKGSIAVDGISLTIADIKKDSFVVNIIPHTLKVATLGFKKPPDTVNIEFDMIGKYARQNSPVVQSNLTEEFLKEHGF